MRSPVVRTAWRKQRHVPNSFPTLRRYIAQAVLPWRPVPLGDPALTVLG
jgi:hypothetical protein